MNCILVSSVINRRLTRQIEREGERKGDRTIFPSHKLRAEKGRKKKKRSSLFKQRWMFTLNDTGFAPWRVRPHYKISISSSPPTFSVRVYVVVVELLNVFEEPFQSMYV